ncbi:MAG: hypothetical protein K9I95_14600 [Flavobacteriaceae bacterium]|nr:hypothetical protein [Flavobacteriaceae bacterium]
MVNFINPLHIILQGRRSKGYKAYGVTVPNWSKEEVTKLGNVASKYGFPPQWLANLINFESGGTFSPAIKNPSSGATGLIQWMPQYFDTKKLSKMSVSQQIDEVDKYIKAVLFGRKEASKVFDKVKKKVKSNFTETDLFMIIFYPSAIGNPNYKFPQKVKDANGGISTPLQYTQKALSSSLIPFPNFTQTMIKPIEPIVDNSEKPMPVGYRVLIFAGISLLAYLMYKKLGKDLAKSPIDLTNIKF